MATSVVLVIVAHRALPSALLLLRILGVILGSQVAVGALNDYVDRNTDQITQPDKPIPSGTVAPSVALVMTCLGFAVLVVIAASFGFTSLAVALAGFSGGLLYDLWLKPTPFSFVGYIIGFLSLVTWIWLVAGRITPWFLAVYPVGSVLLIAANLANSLPDIETDRSLGYRGVATTLGPVAAVHLMLGMYAFVAGAGLAAAVLSKSASGAILIVVGVVLVFAAWVRSARTLYLRQSQKEIFRFVAPAIGLLALGSLLSLSALSG